MINILTLAILTALFLYGTKVTWQPGNIFEKPKLWLDGIFDFTKTHQEKASHLICPEKEDDYFIRTYTKEVTPTWWEYVRKPLYGCPACMSSVWGSGIYIYACSTWNIVIHVVFVVAVCGLTWILLWQFPFDD